MQQKWNTVALHQHCKETGELLYICQAEDSVGKNCREPTIEEMIVVASLDLEDDLRKLHTRIEIAVRMKAMATIYLY